MPNLAIFASGNGSNFQRIAEYFSSNKDVQIKVLIVNKADAYAVERAKKLDIPALYFNRQDFYESDKVLEVLKQEKIDFIILAGFLWLVPESIINAYPQKIINIHPALLPKYGGKGMYGMNVHKAVIAAKESESGITIHYVNADYDEGDIIFQAKCPVKTDDTAESLAERIHGLEYEFFPRVIGECVV